MAKQKKHFTYAGFKIPKINKDHHLTPPMAKEIILPLSDRKGLALAILQDLPCLMIGETGTGKTSAVRYLAYLRQQPYVRVNMTGYTTPDELIGSKSAKNGSTYFENGIITNAMQEGAILVLDEINATPPDSAFILHGLLDDDRQITLPNGEVVKPHKDFRVFATMSPDYEGTKAVNRAFMDRFSVVLQIGILTPKKEIGFLVDQCKIKTELAEKLVTTATLARQAYREQKTLTFVSTRSLLQVANLVKSGLEPKLAYHTAIARKANQKEGRAFADFFNAVFKNKSGVDPLEDDTPIIIEKKELHQQEKRFDELIQETKRKEDTIRLLAQSLAKVKKYKTFKKGSVIVGLPSANIHYRFTNEGWLGIVVEVINLKEGKKIVRKELAVADYSEPERGVLGTVDSKHFAPIPCLKPPKNI